MKWRGKIFILIAITIFVYSFLFYLNLEQAHKNLEVIFLDIGQGDSELIKTPHGQNILIDGGPDSTVLKGLSKNLSWYDRTIDLIILTHPHDDHVTGLIDVLKRYNVKTILHTGVNHDSPSYYKFLELIKKNNIKIIIVKNKQKITLGENSYIDILYPDKSFLNQDVKNLNNTSIVAKLIYKKNSFLFTGDIEKETEKYLVNNSINFKADVLKVAHHGSDTSSTLSFLKKANFGIAVISSGKDNDFGFPSRRVLMRLKKQGTKIFRTDLRGDIRLISDGKKIIINN